MKYLVILAEAVGQVLIDLTIVLMFWLVLLLPIWF